MDRKMIRFAVIIILALTSGCSLMTTQASLQRDEAFEQQKTDREQNFYDQQRQYIDLAKQIAKTPLISVETPDTILADGSVIKGTKVTVNREVQIPDFVQYQNQPTFGERVTSQAIGEVGATLRAVVPFAGAAYGVHQQRKITEAQYQYQSHRDAAMSDLYRYSAMGSGQAGPTISNSYNTTEDNDETSTETASTETSYGDQSGNGEIGRIGDDDYSVADSYNPLTETTSYGDQSGNGEIGRIGDDDYSTSGSYNPTEAPVTPIVPTIVPPVITP